VDSPDEFSRHSIFWWQSKLLYFAQQPVDWLRAQYDLKEEQLGLKSSKYISMHIRHGDKDTETKMFSLESYMCVANKARMKDPALNTIHIATEDPSVLDETKAYSEK